MSTPRIDLDTYCRRIGYDGERTATLATLQAIHTLHAQTIAFENLTPLLGQPVSLDLASLQDKLLHRGRGGYCFEHNTLLWNVLQQLGFEVSGLAARVRWNAPDHTITPITHMLLKVQVDHHWYLVDVGFGGLTLTTPLLLGTETAQATSHETFRITQIGTTYTLSSQIDNNWKALYSFEPHEYFAPDYEVWNWFTSTAPQSLFVKNLVLARPDADGRHSLLNNRYTYRSRSGEVTTRLLTSTAALRAVVVDAFQIHVPNSVALEAKLAQFAAHSA